MLKTGNDHYSHTLYIPGTVRAFHEEARTAHSGRPSGEPPNSSFGVCTFDPCPEYQLDVLASSPHGRSSYLRGGVFPFLPTGEHA